MFLKSPVNINYHSPEVTTGFPVKPKRVSQESPLLYLESKMDNKNWLKRFVYVSLGLPVVYGKRVLRGWSFFICEGKGDYFQKAWKIFKLLPPVERRSHNTSHCHDNKISGWQSERKFHAAVVFLFKVQQQQRNVQKAWCTCKIVVLLIYINPFIFCCSRCLHRHPSFLLLWFGNFATMITRSHACESDPPCNCCGNYKYSCYKSCTLQNRC